MAYQRDIIAILFVHLWDNQISRCEQPIFYSRYNKWPDIVEATIWAESEITVGYYKLLYLILGKTPQMEK